MTRHQDKILAINLRKQGESYNQISKKLKVSKSTLSAWLQNYPLSDLRIKELRNNIERTERFRKTMALKRESRLKIQYNKAKKDIGGINKRDLFIGGLFLYWAEGSKTGRNSIVLTNTNPQMLIFFINWLKYFNISKKKLKFNLHLYSDMVVKDELLFWSKILSVSLGQFRKPYIKKTKITDRTYSNGFSHGTCSVVYENKIMTDYVLSALRIISKN